MPLPGQATQEPHNEHRGHSSSRWHFEEGCTQAVRCTSKEPASTNNPITAHTPARSLDSTRPDEPHPALPEACKHMEASERAQSAPLGMAWSRRGTDSENASNSGPRTHHSWECHPVSHGRRPQMSIPLAKVRSPLHRDVKRVTCASFRQTRIASLPSPTPALARHRPIGARRPKRTFRRCITKAAGTLSGHHLAHPPS